MPLYSCAELFRTGQENFRDAVEMYRSLGMRKQMDTATARVDVVLSSRKMMAAVRLSKCLSQAR